MTVALAAGSLTNGGPRAIGWLGLAAGVAASLATASRTALVVLGVLAFVFPLINVRSKPRTFVLACVVTGLIGTVVFAGLGLAGGISGWWILRTTPGAAYEVFLRLFADQQSPPGLRRPAGDEGRPWPGT